MHMLNFRLRIPSKVMAILLGLLAVPACSGLRGSGGSPVFLIPFLDSAGHESFREVQLNTLSDPSKLEGAAANVYYNPQAEGARITSPIAEPHLGKSGNRYIPLDAASGIAVAAYAFYEHMYDYEKRVLLESTIRWPRTIAVYKSAKDLPPQNEGNASYIGQPFDETVILPFDSDGRVALSFNYGVLGHEHFHAHFEAAVMTKLTALRGATVQDQVHGNDGCVTNEMSYQVKLLRSWNEGLADFYGGVTAETPEFMNASIKPEKIRYLDRAPLQMKSRREVLTCNSFETIDPYFNGEQLSRALFAVAMNDEFPAIGKDGDQLNKWERAARYVMHQLGGFQTALAGKTVWWKSVSPEFAICYFLKDLPLAKSKAQVNQAFSSDFPNGMDQCAAIL
jgi:hypothetical protein